MNTVFIQSNNKQYLGALLAQYALRKNSASPGEFDVKIINVDELEVFKNFRGKEYLRGGSMITYDPLDLQSFTLSRFMPPEIMNYQGRAIVIDPDIFSISDVQNLFNIDLGSNAIAACRKKGSWDTSVMLLDCSKLKSWRISDYLQKLQNGEVDYNVLISLAGEPNILELDRSWNSLDQLSTETKMLHTTNRLTQPWKTGLAIDFTRKPLGKIFGIIPKELVLSVLGRYPYNYQPHPDKNIEKFFFKLVKSAIDDGKVSIDFINKEISQGHIRKDFMEVIKLYSI